MNRIANTRFARLATLLVLFLAGTSVTRAQTTPFTYQGLLTDGGGPATGAYDLQFKLYDALVSGTQIGATATFEDVAVSAGSFTVTLDFGAAAFPGANRGLEVGVRPGASTGAFTALSPLQRITSTRYAIKSLSAAAADGLSVACVNCVTSSQIGSLPANSGNYIQNTATQQASSSFNISGNGLIGGNVGIGTTVAAERLQVEAGSVFLNGENQGLIVDALGAQRVGLMKYPGGEGILVGNTGLANPIRLGRWTGGTIKNPTTVTADLVINSTGNVGIGISNPAYKLSVVASGNHALNAKSDIGIGVWGDSTSNSGVYGSSSISTGITYGVQGLSLSSAGAGVYGRNDQSHGVEGFSTNGTGVAGFNNSLFGAVFGGNSGSGPGVYGQTASTVFNTAGVFGEATAFSGTVVGVYGRANNDPNGTGVAGFGRATGGYFSAISGTGAYGVTTSTTFNAAGVLGEATATTGQVVGVYGKALNDPNGTGVAGIGRATGGYFQATGSGSKAIALVGNAVQDRNSGGLVKAMALIDPSQPAGSQIVRCYNSQATGSNVSTPPCGFTLEYLGLGNHVVDFGFQVTDRFISVTPLFSAYDAGTPTTIYLTNLLLTKVQLITKYDDSADGFTDIKFFIFVY